MKAMVLILLVIGSMIACKTEGESPKEVTNLQVTINVAENGSGEVSVNASAENAVYYEYYFGEEAGETPFKNSTGVAQYTYETSGTYTLKVTANIDEENFIEESNDIEVDIFIYIPETGYNTPESYEGMVLAWSDEFEGTELNEDDWNFEIGDGCPNICGWGNNELEYYTKSNTLLTDGFLVIEARKENAGTRNYTSSRITTQGKQSFKYGRIDIRAVLPRGQGIWPALWMLGNSISAEGWPACGEIDIMEMIGGGEGKDDVVHGTTHWEHSGQYASYGQSYQLANGIFQDEFHVFSITWDEEYIRWFVDDNMYNEILITPAELSEFQEEFFLIFNVAVGGNWPGSPNNGTVFPQRMIVDYVRVFQEE